MDDPIRVQPGGRQRVREEIRPLEHPQHRAGKPGIDLRNSERKGGIAAFFWSPDMSDPGLQVG